VILFHWWWKPVWCVVPFSLCQCSVQLLIIPQPEVARAFSKLARKHLLQQLSVSLWTNNARMILRYWALQGEDSDFPFVKQLLAILM